MDAFNSGEEYDAARWIRRAYLVMDGCLYKYLPDHDAEEAELVVP